jgi:lysyl-tRNA synthetase class 2
VKHEAPDGRPSAGIGALKARAELNHSVRAFFLARGVLEVETPILSAHATVDRHIESFVTTDGRWLHTSPEFAMKRLLAAGSGPIYQIARVFRQEEQGRHHNPEFTLLEWYRPGFSMHQLMDEVESLMLTLGAGEGRFERSSYRDAYAQHAGFDPFAASAAEMRAAAVDQGLVSAADFADEQDRDVWLDLWMSLKVGPALGRVRPQFLYDFPASQAALARIRPGAPALAERFELFWQGLELANGFHELGDAGEQRLRFEADQAWRWAQGRPLPPCDANLIAALAAGLPDCSGVALGLDRVLLLKLGLTDIAATLAFSRDRA